jgi:DNA-binding NtrC family response regulator
VACSEYRRLRIVDDTAQMRSIVNTILRRRGMLGAREASNGVAANLQVDSACRSALPRPIHEAFASVSPSHG